MPSGATTEWGRCHMKMTHILSASVGLFALGLVAKGAEAAPVAVLGSTTDSQAGTSLIQKAHDEDEDWGNGDYYRRYHSYSRHYYHRRYYDYDDDYYPRYERPYYNYSYDYYPRYYDRPNYNYGYNYGTSYR